MSAIRPAYADAPVFAVHATAQPLSVYPLPGNALAAQIQLEAKAVVLRLSFVTLCTSTIVNCVRCGKHAWHVSVMLGSQKLRCPCCHQDTVVRFYEDRRSDGSRLFTMDVGGCFWT